ncbi:RNA-directed DNA polymerase, eukaryota, reverse transcriptase zinc-binding domain protein [Tanacetum coccineum]
MAFLKGCQITDGPLLVNEILSWAKKRAYYFSSFKVPTTIINKLESIRRNFFWGGNSDERKMSWIAWDKVIASLDQGGLNIGSGSHHSNLSTSGPKLIHNFPLPMGLSFTWDWIRPLRSAAKKQELEVCSQISNLCLFNGQVMWECTISDDRRFSVKSMQTYINSLLHPLEPPPFRWSKILPIKINISSWRILHKRLPTRCNLDRRGIDLNSTLCPVCDEDIETEEHLFNSCKVVKDTWSKVFVWWKINTVSISSLSDAINLADKVNIREQLTRVNNTDKKQIHVEKDKVPKMKTHFESLTVRNTGDQPHVVRHVIGAMHGAQEEKMQDTTQKQAEKRTFT